MSKKSLLRPTVEVLEARIAPAAVAALPTIKDAELAYDANPFGDQHFVHAVANSPILLKAGQVLTTGTGARSGTYLMLVQKGEALIFTSDLNNNGQIDYNEITGIAAGDGLRLVSFVDIHGDIVTNLDPDRTLSDSDNNASNNPVTGGDGRVVNNATIEAITMRSLTPADLTDQNNSGTVDNTDVTLRLAFSSYSIFGQVMAGKGFGVAGDPTSGLHVDETGFALQKTTFNGIGITLFQDTKPTIGAIRVGTATNGEYYSFGSTRFTDSQGNLTTFTPPAGQAGGDISYVVPTTTLTGFNFSGAYAGDGGTGARGGNISNLTMDRDDASGYNIEAGNGGRGTTGGAGGSIINFTDLGSATGLVNFDTGNGGQGTNGVGGNGGTLSLGDVTVTTGGVTQVVNFAVNAGVTINLGDGGTGFRGGGDGASLTNIIAHPPEDPVVFGQTVVATTHDGAHDPTTHLLLSSQGVIGRAYGFDFNGDGNNDIVFTTSQPEQLGVAFGDGNGGFLGSVLLDGPSQAQAVAVGDVNGDGHPDIVVGSSASGDFSGVTVFLSQYTTDSSGTHFSKFSSPRISPLPSLNSGDPLGGVSFAFGYQRSSNPITQIAVGDFNGDGVTEIALTATYQTGIGPAQVLMVMQQDYENGVGTGHFYADMGAKGSGYLPFTGIGLGSNARLESTALSLSPGHDLLVALIPGQKTLSLYDFSDPHSPNFLNALAFDKVDTNRTLGMTTSVAATLMDFALIDYNHDTQTDFVALSLLPAGFLMGLQGDGTFAPAPTGSNLTPFFLTNPDIIVPPPPKPNGVLTPDADNSGYMLKGNPLMLQPSVPNGYAMSGLAVLSYGSPAGGGGALPSAQFDTFTFQRGMFLANPGVLNTSQDFGGEEDLPSESAFDTFMPTKSTVFNYAVTTHDNTFFPSTFNLETESVGAPFSSAFGFGSVPLNSHGLLIFAGNGGDGVIGKGGKGGSLGGGTLTDTGTTLTGSVDFTFPKNFGGIGEVDLIAGFGGNGFSSGGAGGNITGVAFHPDPSDTLFTDSVNLFAGDGGNGKAGAGGNGGSLFQNSLVEANDLVAGNGGNGLTGGTGGSVTGHGFINYSDNRNPIQIASAGNGGNGVRRGGAGGSITNFHGEFDLFVSATGGDIQYLAGNGGTAISGPGGAGGDILGISPFTGGAGSPGFDNFTGDILMQGGDGGDGASGGRGGNISNFVNRETTADSAGVLAFIAGLGGDGISGNGGAGGSVSKLNVGSAGNNHSGLNPYLYNHIIAGAGGTSAAAAGGSGGSVLQITTDASDGNYAVAAGAGGDGLTKGGHGGSVNGLLMAVAAITGKGLIVAGSGGSAGAFAGSDASLGFGTKLSKNGQSGQAGRGGDGGDIANFQQTGATDAHFDFIAGNGGDSIFFGSLSDKAGAQYVGSGGSVSNLTVQGNIGNIDSSVPIQSYNDLKNGQSMAQFVNDVLRAPTLPDMIGDAAGNVGIVVGGAGRLKSIFIGYDANHQAVFRSISAFDINNGNLSNVRAAAILSAVADSVERIATIHTVNNLLDINNPSHGPLIGTDKTPVDALQYGDKDSADGMIQDPAFPDDATKRIFRTVPITDGYLIDGALVSKTAPTMTNAAGVKVDANFASGSHTFVIT